MEDLQAKIDAMTEEEAFVALNKIPDAMALKVDGDKDKIRHLLLSKLKPRVH